MTNKSILWILAALGGLGLAIAWSASRGEHLGSGISPGQSRAMEIGRTESPALEAPADVLRDSADDTTVAASVPFLESYWVDLWPSVKAKLDAAGKSVEGRDPPSVPWETAALEVEKRIDLTQEERDRYAKSLLRWDGTVDREWLVSEFGRAPQLSDAQRASLLEIASRHSASTQPLVGEFVDELQRAVRNAWYEGRFIHAPFTTVGAPGGDKRGFYTKGDGAMGWAFGLALTWEDCPELAAIRANIDAMIAARDAEILKFFATL